MAYRYAIHPSIGVARVGNSPDEFYLAPETIGGLPIACDANGDPITTDGQQQPVTQFKDAAGRIKRQAARFKVFKFDTTQSNDPGQEVTSSDSDVVKIEWTVHLANKKAVWYNFSELEGDLMLGTWENGQNSNSYQTRGVPLRNASVTNEADRQKLIIDPGPRTLSQPHSQAPFSKETIPPEYKHGSFPPQPTQGTAITTLGEMMVDAQGNLLVLGAFGDAGGNESITSFAGADTWHDDIADGPISCRLHLASGDIVELEAWVIVGSPKFAPELVNIVTLDDVMFDVGVRYYDLIPDLYHAGTWNTDYVVNYERDIEPIIRRPLDYIWVANVQSMMGFVAPPFDPRNPTEANRANRETYFRYFRRPAFTSKSQQNQLWSTDADTGIPLMPLQSGSNSVSNELIDKFLTLTETQYFMLGQWAAGKFTVGEPAEPLPGVHPLDQASVGNCVGGPMCPGIEVTWSTRNPPIYAKPYQIKHRFTELHYFEHGLSTTHDECEGGGCEPGDLTKRMAIPWQADFFQCTAQFINFTNPLINKADGIPVPPTYYGYWWPPQSPMYVLSGANTVEEQQAAGVPAGFQVYYPRGINSFSQMINAWSYMGFIVNQNAAPEGRQYPYFVEKERDHARFEVASVAVGQASDVVTGDNSIFWPVWYLKDDPQPEPTLKGVPGTQSRRSIRPHARGQGRHEVS